ncbi:amidase [Aspergillus karnatakaensis]|uniref:amidase n=1 Tax=Aspergillus karnatakaensis TaxID=1810916 RepID=UPI003CCDE672
MGSLPIEPWQQTAAQKRQSILDLIPDEWRIPVIPAPEVQKKVTGWYIRQYLTESEIDMTESRAEHIVQQTSSGKWSAVEVTKAFCHRAALAHQLTNCLHEILFTQALDEAARLDTHLATTKTPFGPLHGLPISFKDQFHIHGAETTMGYVGWIGTFEGKKGTGKEHVTESEFVRAVRALGGIPFCKTSLPHTVMSMETWNNIVGYTLNPHNRFMTAGGSSGGEGALLALRGTPLGIGTDIGGSIRVPSSFCGLYGIRPSHGRLPYGGAANSMPGQKTIPSVCGPMAPSVSSLKMLVKGLLTQEEPWLHDPAVVEMPWREELSILRNPTDNSGRLTFGVYSSDDAVAPLPPVKRAITEIVAHIESLGHHTIPWNPPDHQRATRIAYEAWEEDGGLNIHHNINLSGEPLLERIAGDYGTSPRSPTPGDEIHALALRKIAYQTEYMEYWNSTAKLTMTGKPVDAIVAPVTPFASFELGKTHTAAYGPWVNVLDYTAVVVPVTTVDKAVDAREKDYVALSDIDQRIREEYNPQVQHGTPVGLQLVGRRFQEEKMLALAEMFEEAFEKAFDKKQ